MDKTDPLITFYTTKLTTALENPYITIKEQYGNAMLVFSGPAILPITRVKIINTQGRVICDCITPTSLSILSPAHMKLSALWNMPNAHIIPLGINISPLIGSLKIYLTFKQCGDFPVTEEIDPIHLKFVL